MSAILPSGVIKATRFNPRILMLYGVPKVGKTTILAQLPGLLELDLEKGAEALDIMRIPIASIDGPTIMNQDGSVAFTSMMQVVRDIEAVGMKEFQQTGKMPKPPYKYIAVDTLDKLEDFCEVSATVGYKSTTLGKKFEGKSVMELDHGLGYYYMRNEVLGMIDRMAMITEHLILISHVKEKNLSKGGIEVSVRDISLTGKLGQMVAAKADAIGYLYREVGKPGEDDKLMVNFETSEGTVMGARLKRLAGRRFEFDWNEIFLKEAPKVESPATVQS